jgi:hypothetical protein
MYIYIYVCVYKKRSIQNNLSSYLLNGNYLMLLGKKKEIGRRTTTTAISMRMRSFYMRSARCLFINFCSSCLFFSPLHSMLQLNKISNRQRKCRAKESNLERRLFSLVCCYCRRRHYKRFIAIANYLSFVCVLVCVCVFVGT